MRRLPELYRRFAQRRGWIVRAPILIALIAVVATGGTLSLWSEVVIAMFMLHLYVRDPVADGRPLETIGLGPRHAGRLFLGGFAAAAALISLSVLVFAMNGWYTADAATIDIPTLGRFGYWALLFLAVGVFEETFSRGWMFLVVAKRWGVWAALGSTSAVFGLLHLANPNATALSAIGIALHAGLLFGGLLLLTRSLWAPIGAHTAWNLFEGPVWGTPVSGLDADVLLHAKVTGPELWTGGEFGPEAGLVTIGLGVAMAIAVIGIVLSKGLMRWPPETAAGITPATTPPAPA